MSCERSEKPLGHKAYGHIPHLPGSRTGPSDHTVNDGQYRMCCETPARKNDIVVLQEKVDGSNCSVARIGNSILALGRSGYLAQTSRFEMHHRFAAWVRDREPLFLELLNDGERVCGEWLAQAHGTIYEPQVSNHLFRPFDIMRGTTDRLSTQTVLSACLPCGFLPVNTMYRGAAPVTIPAALDMLESDVLNLKPREGLREGCVWRVERDGKTILLAKYVRPEKVDGIYLDDTLWQEVAS